MNMSLTGFLPKRIMLTGFIIACSFLFFNTSQAQAQVSVSNTSQAEMISQLMAMIVKLQAQLEALQALQAEQSGGVSNGVVVQSCLLPSQSLWLGSNDRTTNGDVSKLQQFLKNAGDYTYGQITGYYGPATVAAVQKWQKRNGVVSYGTPDSTGYGTVGSATVAAMRRGCESTTAREIDLVKEKTDVISELKIVSRLPAKSGVEVRLTLPAKYDGKYVLFIVNPVDVAVSSGAVKGIYYDYSDTKNTDGNIIQLNLDQAHEGFATNPGGLHWFDLPSGKYKLTAVIYPKSPFKPGTDMEYMKVGTGPAAEELVHSQIFSLVNEVKEKGNYDIFLDPVSVDIGNKSTYLEVRMEFEVSPENDDLFIPVQVGNAISYTITRDGEITTYETNGAFILDSTADEKNGYYEVREGETESFFVFMKYTPSISGTYKVSLDDVSYKLGSIYGNYYQKGIDDMVSEAVIWTSATTKPTLTLVASPTTIKSGDSVKLSWTSENVTYCSFLGDKESTSGSIVIGSIDSTKTYTMTCTGLDESVSASVTVKVEETTVPAPTMTLIGSPETLAPDQAATISWSAKNATYCSNGDKLGTDGAFITDALFRTTTFTVTCTGPGGSVTKSVTVKVSSTVDACSIKDIYAVQVPGYVYYKLYIKTNGGEIDKVDSSTILGITGAESWNNLKFTRDSASGSGIYIANQTLNGSGVNYVLSRSSNISLLDPSGNVLCKSIGSLSTVNQIDTQVLAAQTISSPRMCVNLPVNMHRGAESGIVRDLQNFLIGKGILLSEATGFYGDQTVSAVKAYQGMVGIKQSGMMYELTRDAVKNETCS